MDIDINKILREFISRINYFLYDMIAYLSNYFPQLKR